MMNFLSRWLPSLFFSSSREYWEQRYRMGGNSGSGSYGESAQYKAAVLNRFVAEQGIRSVIEFGCGDGNQLTLATYPAYLGLDISPSAVERCRALFANDAGKRFDVVNHYSGEQADLALSLDVLYHLVEDDVFASYLDTLFRSTTRFVVIYSSDTDRTMKSMRHVRQRNVSGYIQDHFPGFQRRTDLEAQLPPPVIHVRGIPIRFLIYQKQA